MTTPRFAVLYAVGITLWLGLAYIILTHAPRTNERRIDCGVAEFHPDYTTAMKEACRRVRAHRLL